MLDGVGDELGGDEEEDLEGPVVEHPAGLGPDVRAIDREYYRLQYDFQLKPAAKAAA